MLETVKKLFEEYYKCSVRSEDEVRSKLIVPLTEALGYKPFYRGENFPVYSSHGGKRLPTTFADFVFFDDKDFNNNTKYLYDQINWVNDHCLLVIEAKKPNEIPDIPGQAKFYSLWTRAVAYMMIDGVQIKGWIYNPCRSDKLIIDCRIDKISDYSLLLNFSYENLSSIKQNSEEDDESVIISDLEDVDMPTETLEYMRFALGKNALLLNDFEVLTEYLNTCEYIINSSIRYGLPQFALDLPREIDETDVFIGLNTNSVDSGSMAHSYWKEVDRYQYDSDLLHIDIFMLKKSAFSISIEAAAHEDSVVERIESLNRIIEILGSGYIYLSTSDSHSKTA